jgi:hypothetical protein
MAAEHEFETFVQDVVPAAYGAAMRDGAIDAFLRQGANEIGAALKAFPDAIQVDEPGAVFNPLYSDIAADKRAGLYGSGLRPSPRATRPRSTGNHPRWKRSFSAPPKSPRTRRSASRNRSTRAWLAATGCNPWQCASTALYHRRLTMIDFVILAMSSGSIWCFWSAYRDWRGR